MATSRKPTSRSKKKTTKTKPKPETAKVEASDASTDAAKAAPLVLTPEDEATKTDDRQVAPEAAEAANDADVAPEANTFDATLVDEAKDTAPEPVTEDSAPSDPTPEPAVSSNPTPARQPVFFPLLLGGLIAAGLGFLLSQFLGPLDGRDRVAGLEREISQARATSEDLQATIDQQSATIDELQTTQSEYAAQLSALQAALAEAPQGDPSLLSDELAATLDAQKSEIARLQGELETMAEFAKDQIASAEAEQADAAAAEARVKARGALNTVRNALASGAGFADALPDIAAAVEVPDALQSVAETGVSPLAALQDDFSDAAREALSASLRETAGDTTQDRLKLFLQDQLGARSLAPREGDDPDAVLSRAEAAARSGDLGAAVETLKDLPQSGQDVMSDWIGRAQTRLDATTGFDALEAALNEN